MYTMIVMIALALVMIEMTKNQGIRECNRIIQNQVIEQDLIGYSGYVQTETSNSNFIYYQFYCYRTCTYNKIKNKPIIILLEGGPADSAQLMNLLSNGPNVLSDDNQALIHNRYSWIDFASLMFIDQPSGSGLSLMRNKDVMANNTAQMTQQLYHSLKMLFANNCFANLDGIEIYVHGHGIGAKYALSLVRYNMEQQAQKKDQFKLNIKGMMMASPLVNPMLNLQELGHFMQDKQLVDQQQRLVIEQKIFQIKYMISKQQYSQSYQLIQDIYSYIVNQTNVTNYYNYKTKEPFVSDEQINEYYNDYVMRANDYGIPWFIVYNQNQEMIKQKLKEEYLLDQTKELQLIIDKTNIRVLIYQGNLDLIVNPYGTQKWIQQLGLQQGIQKQVKKGGKYQGWKMTNRQVEYAFYEDVGYYIGIDNPELNYQIAKSFIKQL